MKEIFRKKRNINEIQLSSRIMSTTGNHTSSIESVDNIPAGTASSGSLHPGGGIKTMSLADTPVNGEQQQQQGADDDKESNNLHKRNESQVGSAMRDLTSQRVALGIIIALCLTVLFTYTEDDTTNPATMIVLHNQTLNPFHTDKALLTARSSSVPDMYAFVLRNSNTIYFDGLSPQQPQPPNLRPPELLSITIYDTNNSQHLTNESNNRRGKSQRSRILQENNNNIQQQRTYTTGQFKFPRK
jgi:hypothetical protein